MDAILDWLDSKRVMYFCLVAVILPLMVALLIWIFAPQDMAKMMFWGLGVIAVILVVPISIILAYEYWDTAKTRQKQIEEKISRPDFLKRN